MTFERFLEARMFARQMHWLMEVHLPSLPSISSSLAPTAHACALVALPIQWWFEGWSVDSANNDDDGATSSSASSSFIIPSSRSRVGSFFPGATAAMAKRNISPMHRALCSMFAMLADVIRHSRHSRGSLIGSKMWRSRWGIRFERATYRGHDPRCRAR